MRLATRATAVLACAVSSACAATSPVLVEPRLQRDGEVRLQVGAAAAAPIGGDLEAVREARARLSTPTTMPMEADKALPAVAVAYGARPGVAPVVRATVGLSKMVEAYLQYGGRDIAVSGRWLLAEWRSVEAGATTISVGAGGRALLRGRPEDGYAGGMVSDDVRGYGVFAPLILGWQSDAGLLIAYVAATLGYEQISGRVAFGGGSDMDRARDLSIGHLSGAGTVGVGVGFRKIRVAIELGTRRDWLDTKIDDERAKIGLWSLTPAFSLGWTL